MAKHGATFRSWQVRESDVESSKMHYVPHRKNDVVLLLLLLLLLLLPLLHMCKINYMSLELFILSL